MIVTSDAQPGQSETTQFRYKVFLMTVGDRYQPYEMKITDDKVYFTIIGSKDNRAITHNLRELQVSSIDTTD